MKLLSMFKGSWTAKLTVALGLLAALLPLLGSVQEFLQAIPGDKAAQAGVWIAGAVALIGRAIGWLRAIDAVVGTGDSQADSSTS